MRDDRDHDGYEPVAYLLIQQPEWAAPPLWRSQWRNEWRNEWRNVLAGYLRRDDLNLDQALALQQQAEPLVICQEEPVSSKAVQQIVATSCCTAYGCVFVAVAQQLAAFLVVARLLVLT